MGSIEIGVTSVLRLDGNREAVQRRILQILLLKRLVKGRAYNVAFALPDASVRDQVVQILNDKQVPQAPDLKPSWEAE